MSLIKADLVTKNPQARKSGGAQGEPISVAAGSYIGGVPSSWEWTQCSPPGPI